MATPTSKPRQPVRIGITGGIGAGKSAGLDAFERAGAAVFSADAAVHKLYADPQIVRAVADRWGDAVLDAAGTVDRSAVAKIVFADSAELAWLEALLHPRVGQAWEAFVAELASRPVPPAVAASEVPLLFEAGVEDSYDHIVAITAPLDVRLQRVGERARGNTEAGAREARQIPQAEKAERADFHYVNSGTLADLEAFVRDVMAAVTR